MQKSKTLYELADRFAAKQNAKLASYIALKGRLMPVGETDITYDWIRFAFLRGYEARRIEDKRRLAKKRRRVGKGDSP